MFIVLKLANELSSKVHKRPFFCFLGQGHQNEESGFYH